MKNDFAEKFHRFMSGLTDTCWKMEGKTVLYIPVEGKEIPLDVAVCDKEYIQRMEGRWSVFCLCCLVDRLSGSIVIC